ncbi:hypothetical protein [Kutzneria sp. NPDC051319]|uniref:hypothetical protein n=1 Tax=Kutzneria sp. NPDC051319 TaxID=3155047 RepID=UPI0034155EFF
MSEANVGDLFWAASHSKPLPVVQQEAKSSCCGPKPAATAETATPKASSCCGPKPEAAAKESVSAGAPAEKSSCCG